MGGASLRTAASRGVGRAYGNAPRPRAPSRTTMVGKLVRHTDMGRGVVIEDGGDILTVAFRDRGIKKIARDFVEIDG